MQQRKVCDDQISTMDVNFDMITETIDGVEDLHKEPDVSIVSCCRCGQTIHEGQESFDIDSCHHCVCVRCRFQDSTKCLICKVNSDINEHSEEVKTTDTYVKKEDTSLKKKKKYNTDHIVDVELSTDEGSVQKQMCTVCQRVFKKTNARYHYPCATGDKPFSCVECDQKFVKKSHMEAHMNSHYGIKPFKCTEPKCKASFVQKDKLIRHMKTHQKDVSFVCSVCNKSYTTQAILSLHMDKVHSCIKPFQCDLCPRSYKYKKSLRVHRLRHQAIREYMCEICGKKYTLSAHLKHHKRSHVLYHRRPHKCRCGRRFMTRRDRARHELIHTTSHDYECSLCNTTFGRKDNLERHMKTFHQEDPLILGKATKRIAVVPPFNRNLQTPSGENDKRSANELERSLDSKTPDSCSKDLVNSKAKQKTKKITNKTTKHVKKIKTKNVQKSLKILASQTENLVDNKNLKEQVPINHIEKLTNKNVVNPKVIQTPSVIVTQKPPENQSRPSVIKNVPKYLPYRILPPDKRFLKMSENSKEKDLCDTISPTGQEHPKSIDQSDLPVNLSINPSGIVSVFPSVGNYLDHSKGQGTRAGKAASPLVRKRKLSKDDALNRCYRIICHTNSVHVGNLPGENISSDNIRRVGNPVTAGLERPSMEELSNKHNHRDSSDNLSSDLFVPVNSRLAQEVQSFMCNTAAGNSVGQNMERVSDISKINIVNPMSQSLGGPSLPSSFLETSSDDNFTSPYIPIAESSDPSYTPYFDNDCFRDNVNSYCEGSVEHLLPNDLDIGLQYINEQLASSETSYTSESRIVRYKKQRW